MNKATRFLLHVGLPVAGGSLVGYLANRNAKKQYTKLKTPTFAPPKETFPIVWPLLYSTMGYAHYRVVKTDTNTEGIAWYYVQLTLNYVWSFLFFKWQLRGLALIEMSFLLIAILMTMQTFYRVDPMAGALLIPYFLWTSFAFALNFETWRLNR